MLVATSPVTKHHETKLKLYFHPQSEERYHLWYKTEDTAVTYCMLPMPLL
jgi:hypothetical protein